MKYSVQDIAEHVHGELVGPSDLQIYGLDQLDAATQGQLTFIGSAAYAKRWANANASAALVDKKVALQPGDGRALVRVDDADVAMALALELFAPATLVPGQGVHPSAEIDPAATLGRNVRIGTHAFIGPFTIIGDNCVIHPNVTILDNVQIGANCVLWPGAVIRERSELGDRCIVHPNVTIGGDGFGYRPAPVGPGLIKIPQIGIVVIGCDVEIGSSSCVDRGKFGATTIGDGTKIDNLCQIAHNCKIGRWCRLAGQVGLAGNVTLGDGVVIGGKASVRDHVTIGPGSMIAGQAAVAQDVKAGVKVSGIPAQDLRVHLKQVFAVQRLPELIKTVRGLKIQKRNEP